MQGDISVGVTCAQSGADICPPLIDLLNGPYGSSRIGSNHYSVVLMGSPAVDASMIVADADRQHGIDTAEDLDPEAQPVSRHLDVLPLEPPRRWSPIQVAGRPKRHPGPQGAPPQLACGVLAINHGNCLAEVSARQGSQIQSCAEGATSAADPGVHQKRQVIYFLR